MSEIRDLIDRARTRACRTNQDGPTRYMNVRRAFKPKALLGTKLRKNEWEWLPYRSSAAWMAEWHEQLRHQEAVEKFEEEMRASSNLRSSLGELIAQCRRQVRRGRPRKRSPELVRNGQTEYGLKLLELEEKYPVNSYYWNDRTRDPREIPWGSLEDLDRLVNQLL